MAVAISGFFEFAISKVVDQFFTTPEDDVDSHEPMAVDLELAMQPTTVTAPVVTKPNKQQRPNQNTRRATRRKAAAAAKIAVDLPTKTRSYSDAEETASNASTCGSSDDEDDVEEDIGAKEMRLMIERAEQIKRLAKQTRQQRPAQTRVKVQTIKAKDTPLPDVRAPIRIQNSTNALWNWSVYSGFVVDKKLSYRGPRNMRNVYCSASPFEKLESEEMLLEMAECILADN